MNSKSVTIETVLDGPLSKFQALALGLCMLVGLVDGYDVLTMAYAAPVMQKSLMLSPTVLGMLFSTGIGGGIFGLLVCGTLADRLGRRPLLLAAVGIFAVFTYMTAVVGQPSLLFAVRFLAGVGLGVGTAVAFASNAEWAPPKIRVTAISGVTIGYSIGAGSGGFLAGYLIPAFGWQSIF
ncbi:MFS transporter [Caballeronia sp. 15711]|uniref:MFS transporter n=1 Tax=Caballeronia sp. 15711 TaxID=3391029 RepID=UPI0039E35BD2